MKSERGTWQPTGDGKVPEVVPVLRSALRPGEKPMNDDIKVPDVTVEDVLAGEKEITVRTRAGEDRRVRVKALPWRKALHASECFGSGANSLGVETVLAVQPAPLNQDAFLDALEPAALPTIAAVAMLLSNGVAEAKKRMAKLAAPPALATTSPSSGS